MIYDVRFSFVGLAWTLAIMEPVFRYFSSLYLVFSVSQQDRHGTKTDIVNVMVLEECTNSIILIVQTAHYLIQSYVCDSFPALIFVVWLGKGHEENKEEKLARCK